MLRRATVILAAAWLTACGPAPEDAAPRSQRAEGGARIAIVYTVNYPLAWAARQLAGDRAEVRFPAPAGVDPAFWEPDLSTIAAYQQADRILLNGAGYARWLAQVSLPVSRMVDTSHAFADHYIAVDAGPAHSHGPEGEHSHGEMAFTLWLDLSLYQEQVAAVAETLSELLPDHAATIGQRHEQLAGKLTALDAELQSLGEQLDGAPVLYSHPVYQYFQRRYDINGFALHWEPDRLPSDRDWAELAALLQQHPAQLMLWEDAPLPDVERRLHALGVEVVVFRPQGNVPADGDFLGNLRADIENLTAAVAAGK